MNDALQQLLDRLTALLAEKPLIGAWYTTVVRFVFPLLALMKSVHRWSNAAWRASLPACGVRSYC